MTEEEAENAGIICLSKEAGQVPRRLSSALNCLEHLYMNLVCLDELHELRDKLLNPATRDYVDQTPASFSDVTLNHLMAVKLQRIAGTRPEMQLIKLLLAIQHRSERESAPMQCQK
ncbi:PREDICTED: uncharacterized protein LOC109238763 [Nicotiana attenuata]|nr:PREDICTED: uncharacterized protein LOC109238763 [Nicotiana attenuata]